MKIVPLVSSKLAHYFFQRHKLTRILLCRAVVVVVVELEMSLTSMKIMKFTS